MSRSSGDSTTSATKAIEKFTVRFRRSEVRIACNRLSVGRLSIAGGAAATGSSKTGKDPLIIVLGSAPRIPDCPEKGSRHAYVRSDLCKSVLRFATDLDRVTIPERQLIERQPPVEGGACIARIVQLFQAASNHGLFEVGIAPRTARSHDRVAERNVRRHEVVSRLADRTQERQPDQWRRTHSDFLDVLRDRSGHLVLQFRAKDTRHRDIPDV